MKEPWYQEWREEMGTMEVPRRGVYLCTGLDLGGLILSSVGQRVVSSEEPVDPAGQTMECVKPLDK